MDKTTGFKNGFVIPVNMLVKVAGVPEFIAKEIDNVFGLNRNAYHFDHDKWWFNNCIVEPGFKLVAATLWGPDFFCYVTEDIENALELLKYWVQDCKNRIEDLEDSYQDAMKEDILREFGPDDFYPTYNFQTIVEELKEEKKSLKTTRENIKFLKTLQHAGAV